MKILTISESDIIGGASMSTYARHNLVDGGVMYVNRKRTNNPTVVLNRRPPFSEVKRVFSKFLDKSLAWVFGVPIISSALTGSGLNLDIEGYDLIHLGWINNNFLSISDIRRLDGPIIWTLHDIWPVSYGSHYYEDENTLSNLRKKLLKIVTSSFLESKRRLYDEKDITLVCPSNWMKDVVLSSGLISKDRVHVIHNSVNSPLFKKKNKMESRKRLNMPKDKKILLFGAVNSRSDSRKGFHLLAKALDNLKDKSSYLLVVFGSDGESEISGIKTMNLGYISDYETLSSLYCASDVTIHPSMYDNLPNVVLESMSCGTPVVAFNIGGIPDMVRHKENGYLADPFNIVDLSNGIEWVLKNRKMLSENSLDYIKKNFDESVIKRKWLNLCKKIIDNER